MKKAIIVGAMVGFVLAGGAASSAYAQNNNQPTVEELQARIQTLLTQLQSLQEQVSQLQTQQQETAQELKEVRLQLNRQLEFGMRGEDVETLQEILATDPEIYPEGLTTGYYGPLTRAAVQRFQEKAGISQVGRVGPQTLSKINELLEEGAGNSGQVPPGLLIAPGIQKKLQGDDFEFVPPGQGGTPPGQQKKPDQDEEESENEGGEEGTEEENGDEEDTNEEEGTDEENQDEEDTEDTTAPEISSLGHGQITATSAVITWDTDEASDSTVWYGTSTPVEQTDAFDSVEDNELVEEHVVELTGLTADTTYYYVATSADEAGNTAESTEQSFTTASE